MEPVRALLVDDHPLFREGFMAAVQPRLRQIVFSVAGSVRQARESMTSCPVDIVLADWRLPDGDGLALLADIGSLYPACARVLLSGADDAHLPERARAAGLQAYLPKTLEPLLLAQALASILHGDPFFPATPRSRATSVLTPRQLDILTLVSRGQSNKEIGRELDITERTVKDHVSLIFTRLGAVNRADAIARAASRGLI